MITLLRNAFSIDLRCLGLFRIGVGLTILWDLCYRFADIDVFYTDQGAAPRINIIENSEELWRYSLNMGSGNWYYQFGIFLLLSACTLALTVGFRTRLVTVLSWILVCSIQARNYDVNHGGDDTIRHFLFWMMFLPTGTWFSVDALLASPSEDRERAKSTFSVASAGILLQFIGIYFFSALEKWHPIWHTDSTALYYAFHGVHLARPLATWLLQFPELLKIATWVTWRLELVVPLLAFWPWRNQWLRLALVPTMMGMHLGIALTLDIGLFPLICAIGWLMFLPPMAGMKIEEFFARIFSEASTFWKKIPLQLQQLQQLQMQMQMRCVQMRCVQMRCERAWSLFIACLVALMLWANVENVASGRADLPSPLKSIVLALGLDQNWRLFAPYPFTGSGWYVIPAKRFNGETIDLFSDGKPVDWKQPARVHKMYSDPLWQKFMMGLWLKQGGASRVHYARYLCRIWNRNLHFGDPEAIDTFEIIYMSKDTPAPGASETSAKPLKLWTHFCFTSKLPRKGPISSPAPSDLVPAEEISKESQPRD